MGEQQMLIDQMRLLFEEADEQNSGYISFLQFQAMLQKDKLQASLKGMGINADEALDLFELLDVDDNGVLVIEELVHGALKIHGTASALRLATFVKENKQCMLQMYDHLDNIESAVRSIASDKHLAVSAKHTF